MWAALSGVKMGAKGEKGKIAKSEWPGIIERHAAGDSLASIARSYGCTGPAIRYIIDRHNVRVARQRKALRDQRPPDVPSAAPKAATRGPGNGQRPATTAAPSGEGGIIDSEVRLRVTTDIASFLIALETASHDRGTATARSLFEATDRLLRAAARVMLELELRETDLTKIVPIAQIRAGRDR